MIMELRLLPPDLLKQKECAEILNDYITSFRHDLIIIIIIITSFRHDLIVIGLVLTISISRDLVTYEQESGREGLERFNESINNVKISARRPPPPHTITR